MKITDKRLPPQTMTFADLNPGDWFEYTDGRADTVGPRMKTDSDTGFALVPIIRQMSFGEWRDHTIQPTKDAPVRRLEIEIIITGAL